MMSDETGMDRNHDDLNGSGKGGFSMKKAIIGLSVILLIAGGTFLILHGQSPNQGMQSKSGEVRQDREDAGLQGPSNQPMLDQTQAQSRPQDSRKAVEQTRDAQNTTRSMTALPSNTGYSNIRNISQAARTAKNLGAVKRNPSQAVADVNQIQTRINRIIELQRTIDSQTHKQVAKMEQIREQAAVHQGILRSIDQVKKEQIREQEIQPSSDIIESEEFLILEEASEDGTYLEQDLSIPEESEQDDNRDWF